MRQIINKLFSYCFFCYNSEKSENRESKRRKVCRSGAGVEETPNMCNTPGFPLRIEPKLVRDLRGFDRLELPRNNRRIVTTSKPLVQSWRANCDIQILLYEGNSAHPIPEEIGRVTDYIVAYACKGNESLIEEMKQNKALILGMNDTTGTIIDVKRIARKLLNKTTKDKVISKQESMCHLAKLDLYLCSETIETVSISGEYRLCTSGQSNYSFLTKYAERDSSQYNDMSLHQYFDYIKNNAFKRPYSNKKCIIPHYVGARSSPTYPPTEGYAKSVLLLHDPWIKKFDQQALSRNYIEEFKALIKKPDCPAGIKIGYERAKARYEQKKQFVEPTGKRENICYESFSTIIDDSVEEIVALASTLGYTLGLDVPEENEFFYGDDSTDWSTQHYKV